MNDGMIFDLEHGSFVDGPGIRTTVFFKGCNLRCAWCHNPESQSATPQLLVFRDKCIGCGRCREVCAHALETCKLCGQCALQCPSDARKLYGRLCRAEEIIEEIAQDRLFYESTGGGVTFSGGECMLQIDFLSHLLQQCRTLGIHTAVDTAGHVPFSYFERILPDTDLFLYDVKCMDNAQHEAYTGVGNERILDNLQLLLQRDTRIWVRVPVIPGVNDSTDNMRQLKAFFDAYGHPEKIELLPYHALGEHKYTALDQEVRMFNVPDEAHMMRLRTIFDGFA